MQKIQKKRNEQKKGFANLSPYLQDNTSLIMDGIISAAGYKLGLSNYLNKDTIDQFTHNYSNGANEYDEYDEYDYTWDYEDNEDYDSNEEQKMENETIMEWLHVAKNFAIMVHKGYQMYKTIQLSEKILDKNENKYRKSLKKISDEFEK